MTERHYELAEHQLPWLCPDCGAMVLDIEVHNIFHNRLKDASSARRVPWSWGQK